MTEQQNPSVRPGAERAGARKRIPMSISRRKLEVPELPGYFLYWFLESNVPRAIEAGYEFADSRDLPKSYEGLGTGTQVEGNADLGSHIRVVAGIGQTGEPEYHVLMKLREEWRQEDQRALNAVNAQKLEGIFGKGEIAGSAQVSEADRGTRYVKQALLQRPVRKK